MTRAGFWKADWLIGLVLAIVMLAVAGTDLIQSLERKAYDMGVRFSSKTPSDEIAVIAIDDMSIANIGRWPWSREVHAKMTDLLVAGKARVIGNTVLLYEPQVSPGYQYITKLMEIVSQPVPEGAAASPETEKIAALLKEAESALNTDRTLSESYGKANTVLLPMTFRIGAAQGRPDKALPAFVAKNRLEKVQKQEGGGALEAYSVQFPIELLGGKASALGHLNYFRDVDGAIRAEPLVIQYYDEFYPSMALMIAAKHRNLEPKHIEVKLGEEVKLGNLRIPTDEFTLMNTFFYKGLEARPAFQVDSFYDVYSGKIPASKYAGKIVLIGGTAEGVGSPMVTPVSSSMDPVLNMAHSVSSILQQHFFITPTWGVLVSIAAFLLVSAYLIVLLPRLSAGVGAGATVLLLVVLIGGHFGLMVGGGLWIRLMLPATLLLLGHLLLTTKRFLVTERGKEKADMESAESNRMLGLAFQGQGQLDMAFDKFRKCPMDDGLMENLYNLALDYERKRQFNKAEAVYRYMADYRLDFRDLPHKLALAKKMSETVLLGSSRGQAIGGTVIVEGQSEKPMLGRYQVEKELGKGAMGVVYLGRDPKINRVVAIKTMALSQEFDEDELVEVKERFFREAETAGRLNHPNIVTMYDAGEEQDLAYIAMEFLKGKDLVPFTKPGALLPLEKVLSIIARVADALDYAHQNNVVHRDIKPGNIMYEPESDQVKVTDFGIARITDSSKTKTGMVLGTPSYMSPEQLVGKKIDGRSDLFSLGVTLYQMCCGQLPFVGDSMAQLMFKIANEPPQDISALNPQLPASVIAVIDKALVKDAAARYQRGAEMVADLRACLAQLGGSAAGQPVDVDIRL